MTHDEHYDLMLHSLRQIDGLCLGVYEEPPGLIADVYRIAHAANMMCDAHQDWIDEIAKGVDESARIRVDEFYADPDALKNAKWKKGGRFTPKAPRRKC